MASWTPRTVVPLATTMLLVLSALLTGLVVPASGASAGTPAASYLHWQPDGHVWRHVPETGHATDLGLSPSPFLVPLAGPGFSFGAAGDYGFSGDTQAVWGGMGSAGLDFVIAVGDFSYGSTSPDNWCNNFESHVGDGHAILISGNHDDSDIDTFRQYCNFGIDASMTGDYGKEFYFDYPRSSPLVRFILTACGTLFSCSPGDPHYGFVSNAIDAARNAGIPWVIVGMHKDCITDGSKSCEIGQSFWDLLLAKRVDLILQGHDHNYQRSHQLTCAQDDNFRPECIADTDDDHVQGDGTVLNIVGTGGQGTYSTGGKADEGYFKTWSSSTKGFLKVDVSAGELNVNFKPAVGSYTDAYRIVRGSTPSPDFTLSASPTSVSFVAGQSAPTTIQVQPMNGYTGTIDLAVSSSPPGVAGDCSPASLPGGGTSTCVLASSTPGPYTVTVTGTGGTLVHSASLSVLVGAPEPGPDTTPPSLTITSPTNDSTVDASPVTIRGVASDNVAVAEVDWSSDGTTWAAASGTGSWSAVVPLDGGPHTIYVRAKDTAGNEFVSTLSLVVQTNPGVPAHPVDTAPRLFGIPVFPTWIGMAAGVLGLAAVIAFVARRRTHR